MQNGELTIPASAFEVKANYFERPSRAVVSEIKQYIKTHGTPHLWSGHTHNTPASGVRVTFLGKYRLPESHRSKSKWAPCPCCSLMLPKYYRQGLIAWFQDEGVIRCTGDLCYKKMDPVGYEVAMNLLDAEIASERNADYLIQRIPLVPEYIKTIESNLETIEAIDSMRNDVLRTLDKRLAVDNVWRGWPRT